MDFHKKFEKSFHEMFLMITASFKTFDASSEIKHDLEGS